MARDRARRCARVWRCCACALLAPRASRRAGSARGDGAARGARLARARRQARRGGELEGGGRAVPAARSPPERWVETLQARSRAARGARAARRGRRRRSATPVPALPDGGSYALVRFRVVVRERDRRREERDARASGPDDAWRVIGYAIQLTRERVDVDRDRRAVEVRLSRRAAARPTWNPAKQKLVCPFCGTESAGEARRRRRDRRARSRRARCAASATTRAAGRPTKRQVKCQSCNAISVLDPTRQAQNCEFCGSAQLVPYDETKPAHSPGERAAVQGQRDRGARPHPRVVRQAVARAVGAQAKSALTDTVRGVYLPYWTFDARVDAAMDRRGRPLLLHDRDLRARAGACRRARCSTCAGSRPRAACSISSTTTSSARRSACTRRCCAASSRFRPSELKPYDAGFVAGWVVERYQIDLVGRGAARARRDGREAAGAVRAAGSGRHVPQSRRARATIRRRRSSTSSRRSGCCRYTYGARAFQCAMNGVTGAIRGEYPKSPWKIALLVLAILSSVLIVLSFGTRR